MATKPSFMERVPKDKVDGGGKTRPQTLPMKLTPSAAPFLFAQVVVDNAGVCDKDGSFQFHYIDVAPDQPGVRCTVYTTEYFLLWVLIEMVHCFTCTHNPIYVPTLVHS